MIEFQAGEVKELNVLLSQVITPLSFEDMFLLTNYVVDDSENVLFCNIRNNGDTPITQTLHFYIELNFGSGSTVKTETKTFTVEPKSVYTYRYYWGWTRNGWAKIWIIGDWGEQTPIMVCDDLGHKYTGDSDEAEFVATHVEAESATFRYAQFGACDTWTFRYCTPPWAHEYEQYKTIRFSVPSGEPVGRFYTCIYNLVWDLIPARSYRGRCQGGPAWRTGECTFNT